MTQPVVSRFAPSPTGDLHLGSARTALFAWLYARHNNGQFILRIEDTDKARSTKASTQAILEAMDWMRLDYDQGPIFQSDRTARYEEVLQQLLDSGKAYRCTCSKERLDALREQQMAAGGKPKYDGHCRDLDLGADCGEHVIRFRNPQEGVVTFKDQVKGEITVANTELDDFIIARSDGSPTYNFTVVVDDSDMGMTHVVRGDDHVNNTPRQINLFKALDFPQPTFAHVPTILGSDGKRLSKRHGAQSVMHYAKMGILPEALMNYLLRLGFSYGDKEIFTMQEMIELFDPNRLNSSPAAFDEKKLLWLNQHHMKQCDLQRLQKLTVDFLPEELKAKAQAWPAEHWQLLLPLLQERCDTLQAVADKAALFFQDMITYDEKAKNKWLKEDKMPVLQALYDGLKTCDWQIEAIHQVFTDVAEAHDLKLGKVAQPLRVAITGNTVSPPLDVTVYLLGRDRVVSALEAVITA
jgi:glutamyl-tRNA synthetase